MRMSDVFTRKGREQYAGTEGGAMLTVRDR